MGSLAQKYFSKNGTQRAIIVSILNPITNGSPSSKSKTLGTMVNIEQKNELATLPGIESCSGIFWKCAKLHANSMDKG
jgi:hypothetical protein